MFKPDRLTHFVMMGLLLVVPGLVLAGEKYKLEEPVDDVRVYGVGTRINITGKIQAAPKGPQMSQSVSAALSYRERRLLGPGSDAESFRSVREYEQAEADISVDDNKTKTKLQDGLKMIVAQGKPEGVELYCLNGQLAADELDLIRSPADSLALMALLPAKEVEVGNQWTVPSWSFQMLTALDAVVKGQLECTLESVENGLARVKMEGTLEGAAVGSQTEVTVSGFFNYHLADKFIKDTDFTQRETRAVGPVSPGLDISARVRVLRQPGTSPGKLADQKILDSAAIEPDQTAKFLRFESPWNIGMQHGRYWHLRKVEDKLAQFRLLQEGNLIAQCDIAPIAAAKAGAHLPEQTYLAEIRQSLGDRLKTMSSGEVIPSSERKFVYRVVSTGAVGDRQVTWIFYLVADPSGRQASLMFTVDTALAEKLAKYDREIVDSLRFGPAPVPRSARN